MCCERLMAACMMMNEANAESAVCCIVSQRSTAFVVALARSSACSFVSNEP